MEWLFLIGGGIVGAVLAFIFLKLLMENQVAFDSIIGAIAVLFFGTLFILGIGVTAYSFLFGLPDIISAIM